LLRVGVDIGGTFTDLVAQDDHGQLVMTKVMTTPANHAEGIMTSIAKAGIDLAKTERFLHGSTIAINTVVERKGVKTALLTTRGFRDVYEIGRSNRPDAYNLFFERPKPLVPRSLCREITERITALGEVDTPLETESAAATIAELKEAGVQSIAVCLLHSYANPEHEIALGRVIGSAHARAYVSLSHRILREYREYERTSTTVINAYVGPVVARYLASLQSRLRGQGLDGEVLVMQSGGGVMSLSAAMEAPVRTMESGPVAGVMGTTAVARSLGYSNAIAFDMGGTTAKASMIKEGGARIAGSYYIGGYSTGHPVMLPVVDIIEVGSGGGSIAWLDKAGGLKVGPVSAGAAPGPACYGRGGTEPTVTDANLLLGLLGEESFLGGEMPLDRAAAERAVQAHVARPLALGLTEAASGIVRIADAHMALALRAVSVERGEDPRDFALVAFGGAGPLHACTLARDLGIPVVIVPRMPGQFSAWGMLVCPLRRDYVQTLLRDFENADADEITAALDSIVREGLDTLARERRSDGAPPEVDCMLDLRYRGQEHSIAVPLGGRKFTARDRAAVARRFHDLHMTLYGHAATDEPLEVVGVRATVQVAVADGPFRARPSDTARFSTVPRPFGHRRAYMGEGQGFAETPVYRRSELAPGSSLAGPAIIEEATSTTVVLPGDGLTVGPTGELIVRIADGEGRDA
jgi:N-methylhydantoinase A